jgi:hypothetical protein
MSFEVKDLAGLSQPLTKLVEAVSSAIGSAYRPKAVRQEADAKAYEFKVLARAHAEAEVEAKDIALSAGLKRIDALIQARPDLAERARQRLLVREIEGQLNIEAIADHASAALPIAVSDEPLSPDWRRKFFLEAENVCQADLQLLWGKVLAGELSSPGAFGLRTLDTLRQLTRHEAELFRCACSLAMAGGWIAIPGHDLNVVLKEFGLSYGDLMTLRDAGLLMDGNHLHKDFSSTEIPVDPTKQKMVFFNNDVLIELSGPATIHLKIHSLVFTRAGTELQQLIESNQNQAYLAKLGSHLRSKGLVVKRGSPTPQDDGSAIIDFELDL